MIALLLLLWSAALAYQLLAWVSLGRFFRPAARPPAPPCPPCPGITVFKPVRGLEPETRECLETFLSQDYQPYQVLFGVADENDPVLPIIRAFTERAAGPEVQVVVCPDRLGLNPKVSTLCQLAPLARYDLLVIADADVRVAPDFLATVAAALSQPTMGLVSCPYRAGETRTLGAGLEGLTIAADFIPSVAAARVVEGVSFALGAAMALTREAYQAIGGFAPLADFLADDYQLGHRVRQAGFGVDLLPYVVETVNPDMSFLDFCRHQIRWSRTYRVCRPGGYLAYGLTHALVFAAALWLAAGWAAWAGTLVGLTAALRLGLAASAQRLGLGGPAWPWAFALLPVKDGLAFGFWLLSFLGNTVVWSGRRFRVTPSGRLVAAAETR
jgi:ceramide glucosyltransferase